MASCHIYQFYAELDDFKPKIWRRFQVKSDITVAMFGCIVQVLFEMRAYHLMAVEVPPGKNSSDNIPVRYEILHEDLNLFPDPDDVRTKDAAETKLRSAVSQQNDKLFFNYDFGDDWWVLLKLEKILTDKDLPDAKLLPLVLDGAGFGIVEDVGGTPGLTDLVKAFKNKKGADYKHFKEWLDIENFDIAAFDLDDMNFRLKKIPLIFKRIYVDGQMPTKKSIGLIQREYLQEKP